MVQRKTYQPLLFRIFHGIHGLLVVAALLTGFWVYNTYDGQFGKLPSLPQIDEVEGVHGTFGLWFFLILPIFALYSFHVGRHRLIGSPPSFPPNSSAARKQLRQRQVNTLMLLAATLSAVSGRLMKEDWILNGTLVQQPLYYFHLSGWLVMVFCLLLHLFATLKTGGTQLLTSSMAFGLRSYEHPRLWPDRIRAWWFQPGTGIGAWWRSLLAQPAALRTVEYIVLGGLLVGLIAPAFLPGE
jgi:hypothetical protein